MTTAFEDQWTLYRRGDGWTVITMRDQHGGVGRWTLQDADAAAFFARGHAAFRKRWWRR
jgi:hypothetical protein